MKNPRNKRMARLVWTTFAASILALAIPSAHGQNAKPIYSFLNSGAGPSGVIQGNDGYFYGVTTSGGLNNEGTVFKLLASGSLTVLHSFTALNSGVNGTGLNGDGANPQFNLVQGADGNFYGTTSEGGLNGIGTIFKITSSGSFATLYSFGTVGGASMLASGRLTCGSDGNLYGTTSSNDYFAGSYPVGTIFKITPSGSLTTLYTFTNTTDGVAPTGGLVQGNDGSFYGCTYGVHGSTSEGTAYKITVSGSLTTLHSFTGLADGGYPCGNLVTANDGKFYGTTQTGGANGLGTAFQLTSSGSLTTLCSFSSADTGGQQGPLMQGGDGNLYGATNYVAGQNYSGTVFQVTLSGSVTTLHSFAPNNIYGYPGQSLVQGNDGDLYGVLNSPVGPGNIGGVYKIATSGDFAMVYSFNNGWTHGFNSTELITGSDGNMYGNTRAGGPNNNGTVFQITTSGSLTTLYTFSALTNGTNSDGANPQSGLIQGNDGNYYGTTQNGGAYSAGTFFEITASGLMTVIHSFNSSLGEGPSNLLLGSDGIFYGTGRGEVFSITAGGLVTRLGGPINSNLIQGADGDLFGTEELGGANGSRNGYGALEQITTSGSLTTIYSFSATSASPPYGNYDGSYPEGGVIQGVDGNFYGTAWAGGTDGLGTVFEITASGSLTTLHSFSYTAGAPIDGYYPQVGMVQGGDESFYGTTSGGGSGYGTGYFAGTVFQITPTGAYRILFSFNGTNGSNPDTKLTFGPDGNLYGATSGGEVDNGGAIFQLIPPPNPVILTQPASVSINGAVMSGIITPNGDDANVAFLWGTSNAYGNVTTSQEIGSGFNGVSVSGTINGLQPNTTYHYKIVTTSTAGSFYSTDQAFTTAPTFTINAAVVTGAAVTFSAIVNPNGFAGPPTNRSNVLVFWQYGLSQGAYTSGTTTAILVGTGTAASPVSYARAIKGLSASVYHYQLVISSTLGKTYGPDQIFSVEPPNVTINSPSDTLTGSTVSATINSDGNDTQVYFKYGLTTKYGSLTASQDIGAGSSRVAVNASLSSLTPDTLYHYCVVTVNALGTFYGPDQTFTTSALFGTTAVVGTRQSAPGITGTFSTLGIPIMNDLDHIAFQATVTGPGLSATAGNSTGIWADIGNSGLELVTQAGSSAPDYTGTSTIGTFASLSDPVYADSDAIAFLGKLVVSGTVTTANNSGIWVTSGTGTTPMVLLARVGDPAPDSSGSTSAASPVFANISQFVLPQQGGVVLLATLKTGVGGVAATNSTGIWGVDIDGLLKQIIRTGQSLTVNGAAKTITALTIFNSPTASTGQTRHFNNAGDLTYKATFNDGSSWIIQSVFP